MSQSIPNIQKHKTKNKKITGGNEFAQKKWMGLLHAEEQNHITRNEKPDIPPATDDLAETKIASGEEGE